MASFVVRMWLPDRPGALGQVAARIGAAQGDVVGIDILERGGGRAVDELVVELPDPALLDLLLSEVREVDGVDVEDVWPLGEAVHDPRLDALEIAAILVGASTVAELLGALCAHGSRLLGASWAAVLEHGALEVAASTGDAPPLAWLHAFVEGSRSTASDPSASWAVDDVVWAPLPSSGLALVCGRDGTTFRARERRQAAALARIVDTRARELATLAKVRHPSMGAAAAELGGVLPG